MIQTMPLPNDELATASTTTSGQTSVVQNGTDQGARKTMNSKIIFFLGLLLAASGLVSPPIALVGGIAYGFAVEHPMRREASALAKLLLQGSVILLGFGMNLNQVAHAGKSGFLYTAISITSAVALGLLLGKLLKIRGKASYLITMGTAICGGSAIAALAPITEANEEEISISMGTVFLLNSIALLVFPVVGAAAKYGPQALMIGTTVKLARALWIVPISLLTASVISRLGSATGKVHKAKVKVPWFIFLFILASVASTYLVRFAPAYGVMNHLGRVGLTATLFLIGSSLSKKTLKQVGFRPLLQGVLLWIIVGCASLAAIYYHFISI